MRIIIRKARLKDVKELVELWNEFSITHDSAVVRKNTKLRSYLIMRKNVHNIIRKYISKAVRSRTWLVEVADADTKLVGFCMARIKKNIPIYTLDRLGYITDFYVRKEFQGLRIGSRFKNDTLSWLRKNGVNHIELTVSYNNLHARKVYEKWGFINYNIDMRKRL